MAKDRTDMLKRLQEKVQTMNLGGDFWKPSEGMTTIRILPPVGNMEYFFMENGRHYDQKVSCPQIVTDGEDECPVCEVWQSLLNAGERDNAKKFRPGRAFHMNIIVRKEASAGVRVFTPGVTVFGLIWNLIKDPDYGLVYDVDEGFDLKLTREGTGIETKYSILPSPKTSALGTEDEMAEWLGEEFEDGSWDGGMAKDLHAEVMGGLLPYNDLLAKSGVGPYLDAAEDDPMPWEGKEDEEEETPVSKKIRSRMEKRKTISGKKPRRTVSRRTRRR